MGVLWRPPPPLWRPGWAWLHAASAGLGEAEAVSAPGLLSVAVSKLFWRKKPSPQVLKGEAFEEPEGGVERLGSAESETLHLKCCPNVGT